MLADDMVGVLDHFDVEQAAVVGHDWGGIIGFKLVIDNQDRVSRTALMDTLCTVWLPQAIHGFWFKAEPLPEEFFAQYHAEFIAQIFGGELDVELPGWPQSPWNYTAGRLNQNRWSSDDDIRTYQQAFSDPDSQRAAISYYRDALPFHRIVEDDDLTGGLRFDRLSASQVGEIWRAGLENHPHGREHMEYGPEDRGKQFPGPALWMYGDPTNRGRNRGWCLRGTRSSSSSRCTFPTCGLSPRRARGTSSPRRTRTTRTQRCCSFSPTHRPNGAPHEPLRIRPTRPPAARAADRIRPHAARDGR